MTLPKATPGPAVRFAVTLDLPTRVVSEMNRRDHWATRRRRFDRQADALFRSLLALGWYSDADGYRWPFGFPVVVTFVHVHQKRGEMDDDNLRSAFKAIRDAIAEWAGIDDRADGIAWRYEQQPGKPGVEIKIEGEK